MKFKQIIEQTDTRTGRVVDQTLQFHIIISLISFSCSSQQSLQKDDYDILSVGDRITVKMRDGNEHSIVIEYITPTEIQGKARRLDKRIIIEVADIISIEVAEYSTSKSILAVLAIVVPVILFSTLDFSGMWSK
jgi:translation initiation factor IF-1